MNDEYSKTRKHRESGHLQYSRLVGAGAMATYTPDQLSQYFSRIRCLLQPRKPDASEDQLAFLSRLVKHQLSCVPFETLSLHYSRDKKISLDPEDLFRKLVVQRRGGYCQENNTFFGVVLRSLGFMVYGVICRISNASRVAGAEGWRGMSHMANIVVIPDGQRYVIDVGYGPNGPVVPLRLDEATGVSVVPGLPGQELRLTLQSLPEHASPEQKVWVYSHCLPNVEPVTTRVWTQLYHFPDVEFFLPDFDVLNVYNSTAGHWTNTVIAQRFVVREQGASETGLIQLTGSVILLDDHVEVRDAGQIKGSIVRMLRSEQDRLEALEEWFGIILSEEERNGIRGHRTELRPTSL